MLPTFLIAGPPRSASTSLHYYLGQHPQIFASKVKETEFFTHNYHKGIECYEKHFREAGHAKAIGEATPAYSFLPFVAERIKETIPDIKIIFCFRNPLDRAFSHWLMLWNEGVEKSSFADVIKINKEQLEFINFEGEEGVLHWSNSAKHTQKGEKWIRPYLHPGMYARSLNIYLQRFHKDNIKVLFMEDFKNNFDETLSDLFNFLNVDADFIVPNKNEQNFTYDKKMYRSIVKIIGEKYTRILAQLMPVEIKNKIKPHKAFAKKPEMSKQERLALWQIYKLQVAELETITGRNLSHWAP